MRHHALATLLAFSAALLGACAVYPPDTYEGNRRDPYYGGQPNSNQRWGDDREEAVIMAPMAPPPLLYEAMPPRPSYDFLWVPGYWFWQGQWAWMTGRWMMPPAPGYMWARPYYERRGDGVAFRAGHWSDGARRIVPRAPIEPRIQPGAPAEPRMVPRDETYPTPRFDRHPEPLFEQRPEPRPDPRDDIRTPPRPDPRSQAPAAPADGRAPWYDRREMIQRPTAQPPTQPPGQPAVRPPVRQPGQQPSNDWRATRPPTGSAPLDRPAPGSARTSQERPEPSRDERQDHHRGRSQDRQDDDDRPKR